MPAATKPPAAPNAARLNIDVVLNIVRGVHSCLVCILGAPVLRANVPSMFFWRASLEHFFAVLAGSKYGKRNDRANNKDGRQSGADSKQRSAARILVWQAILVVVAVVIVERHDYRYAAVAAAGSERHHADIQSFEVSYILYRYI